jgi:hypothetical protein
MIPRRPALARRGHQAEPWTHLDPRRRVSAVVDTCIVGASQTERSMFGGSIHAANARPGRELHANQALSRRSLRLDQLWSVHLTPLPAKGSSSGCPSDTQRRTASRSEDGEQTRVARSQSPRPTNSAPEPHPSECRVDLHPAESNEHDTQRYHGITL